jgi:hypothetical protein
MLAVWNLPSLPTKSKTFQDFVIFLLLLCGDVETNPGPPTGRISVAKGPSTEEQVYTLNSQVINFSKYIFMNIFS